MAVSFQSGSAGRNLMSPLLSTPSGTVMMTALPAIFSPGHGVQTTRQHISCHTLATGRRESKQCMLAAQQGTNQP